MFALGTFKLSLSCPSPGAHEEKDCGKGRGKNWGGGGRGRRELTALREDIADARGDSALRVSCRLERLSGGSGWRATSTPGRGMLGTEVMPGRRCLGDSIPHCDSLT